MSIVPNGVKTLPKIPIVWVGCTNVTDDRQTTDRRQTDGRTTTYSEREREFTFAKNQFFSALHGMSARTSDEKGVCLSVCLSNACIVTQETHQQMR